MVSGDSSGNAGSALLFLPHRRQAAFDPDFQAVYTGSALAAWAEERTRKFAERVEPQLLYVEPASSHRVAWLRHQGLAEDPDGEPRPFDVYHVMCDCAAEADLPASDFQTDEAMVCDTVQAVMEQRARELSAEHRLDSLLHSVELSTVDSSTKRPIVNAAGEAVLIEAIKHLLITDRDRPSAWTANRINGAHDVGILAVYAMRQPEELLAPLELMEEAGLISVQGATVRLQAPDGIDSDPGPRVPHSTQWRVLPSAASLDLTLETWLKHESGGAAD